MKSNYISKLDNKLNSEKQSIKKKISNYKNSLNSLSSMKTTALDKLLTNVISDSDYRASIEHIDIKFQDLNSKILELTKILNKLNTLSKNDFIDIATELSSIKKLNKDILNLIVKRIEVKEMEM